MVFAPLPAPPAVPTLEQLASLIAAGVPEGGRGRARDVLVADILPWDLRGLAGAESQRRLIEVEYHTVVEQLGPLPAAQRLGALETMACERTGQRVLHSALAVAIGRYLLDHPGVVPSVPWDEVAGSRRWRDPAAIDAEAARQLGEIEQLEGTRSGECREAMRMSLVHARMSLASARSGSFATAGGPLVDFLRAVGESPRVLMLH